MLLGTELAWECDYDLEAESQIKYREFVLADETLRQHVSVPEVRLNNYFINHHYIITIIIIGI